MRLVYLTEVYHPTVNGVVTSIDSFASELRVRGHDLLIVAPTNPRFREEEHNVIRIPARGLIVNRDYFITLPSQTTEQQIIDFKPDLIHIHHIFNLGRFGVRLARKINCPIVLTYHTLLVDYVHHVPFLGTVQPTKYLLQQYLIARSRSFANRVDCIIAPSRPLAQVLQSYGVKNKIEIVKTGINLADFELEGHLYIRQKHHLPTDSLIILYTGRLASEKSVDLLINSFAKLSSKHPNAYLVLLGFGPQQPEYEKLIAQQGIGDRVIIPGLVKSSEAKRYFKSADIFAFPSCSDTQGIVIAEAMAGGAAVLAVNRLGPKDIIEDGKNGLLVEPNLADFSAGLEKLVSDKNLRKSLTDNASKMLNSLTIEHQTDKLVAIYERLINAKNSDSKSNI